MSKLKEAELTIILKTKDAEVERNVVMKNLDKQVNKDGLLEDYLVGMGRLLIKQIVEMLDQKMPDNEKIKDKTKPNVVVKTGG